MSLTSCLTCGHECAKSAKACPNCGQPDPTNLPPTVYEKIEKYRFGSFLVIGLFVFITWLIAPIDKFILVALVGAGIFIVICILLFFVSQTINWKRSLGIVLFLIPAGWGFYSYEHHEYLKVFIAAILSIPGIYITLVNLEDKQL
jgi:glycerol uptake facilitator-like aquaporin